MLSAIGNIVGLHNIRAASRMNKKFVVFVSEEHMVATVVEHGLFIEPNTYLSMFALQAPTVKVNNNNIPPFIRNQDLCNQLNKFGKVVSRISMVPMRHVSDKFKHVMSFKRVVYMILPENGKTLNVVLSVKIDGFEYKMFASSEVMTCFGCGAYGHVKSVCPNAVTPQESEGAVKNDSSSPQTNGEKVNREPTPAPPSPPPHRLRCSTNWTRPPRPALERGGVIVT